MKTHRLAKVLAGLALPALVFALNAAARSEEHHGGEKEEPHGGKKEEVKIPDTYAEAVSAIEQRRDALAKLLESGKLAGLHKEGEVIKKIAQSLAKLAAKEDSGVAKADLKDVNLTAKALAAQYEPLDEAGDAGKKEESKKVYDEMVKLIDTLKKYVKTEKKDK